MCRVAIACVLLSISGLIGGASIAAAENQTPSAQDPRAVVENVIKEVLGVLRQPSLSADQKREKVQQIAYDNLNFQVMGRLSLGRFYRGLTPAQQTQYQQEFKQLVTNTYGHTTDDYTDEDVKVVSDRIEKDGDATVQTHITGTQSGKPNQDIATINYRLRNQDSQWKVIDFTIDGVSIVSNYRSQFEDLMNNGGVDNLLKVLHDKNATGSK